MAQEQPVPQAQADPPELHAQAEPLEPPALHAQPEPDALEKLEAP
jgi:hypothetical protein